MPPESYYSYCCNLNFNIRAAANTVPSRSSGVYHPFPLSVYFNCIGNESSLTDCQATGTLQCTFNNIARVQCAGDMVTGIVRD